jgi:hypothetical protein
VDSCRVTLNAGFCDFAAASGGLSPTGAADTWNLSDVVRKAGWIKLPGQKLDSDLADAIAAACAPKILALSKINGVKLSGN